MNKITNAILGLVALFSCTDKARNVLEKGTYRKAGICRVNKGQFENMWAFDLKGNGNIDETFILRGYFVGERGLSEIIGKDLSNNDWEHSLEGHMYGNSYLVINPKRPFSPESPSETPGLIFTDGMCACERYGKIEAEYPRK